MFFFCNYKNVDGNNLGDDYKECQNYALVGVEIFFLWREGVRGIILFVSRDSRYIFGNFFIWNELNKFEFLRQVRIF